MKYKFSDVFLNKLVDNPEEIKAKNLCLVTVDAVKDKKVHELFQKQYKDAKVGQDVTTSKAVYLLEDEGEGNYNLPEEYSNKALSEKWARVRKKLKDDVEALKKEQAELNSKIIKANHDLNRQRRRLELEKQEFDAGAVVMSNLSDYLQGLGLVARLKIGWLVVCKKFEGIVQAVE